MNGLEYTIVPCGSLIANRTLSSQSPLTPRSAIVTEYVPSLSVGEIPVIMNMSDSLPS